MISWRSFPVTLWLHFNSQPFNLSETISHTHPVRLVLREAVDSPSYIQKSSRGLVNLNTSVIMKLREKLICKLTALSEKMQSMEKTYKVVLWILGILLLSFECCSPHWCLHHHTCLFPLGSLLPDFVILNDKKIPPC